MTDRKLQDGLKAILLAVANARGENDDDVAELAQYLPPYQRVAAFAEDGIVVAVKGFTIEFEDGAEFQVMIVRTW